MKALSTVAGSCLLAVALFLTASNAAAQSSPLSELEFLAGCWAQDGDGLREQFSAPTANMILGTSRYVVDGAVVQFEFHRIDVDDAGPGLTPYPSGAASVRFVATTLIADHVVFENAEHDFPQRISYDGREDGVLVAAIEGRRPGEGGAVRREWRMRRVSCRGHSATEQ